MNTNRNTGTSLQYPEIFPSSLSRICQHTESLCRSAVSRKMDWDGGGGVPNPLAWTHMSRDLTPLDFCLWRYIKDLVYQTEVHDVGKLHGRITAVCETVTIMMLQNTWREVECRLGICRATMGSHSEIYWGTSKHLPASLSEVPNFSIYISSGNIKLVEILPGSLY
jgi:hypothetical protein